jgi:hypothetical protein
MMNEDVVTKSCLLAFSIIACLVFLSPASATEIPLSSLNGPYESDPNVVPDYFYPSRRSFNFVLPDNITAIDQISLVLSGHWYAGEIICTGLKLPEPRPLKAYVTLVITSGAFPGNQFTATIEMPHAIFENLTAEVVSCCPQGVLDLDSLIGAELHAELFIDYDLAGICSLTRDTFGTLNAVELNLTDTVPTDNPSWGRVKSLYR